MKKFGVSLLVLLVLGIFAGLAIAQSGAVTSVLRVNTSEDSLELSNTFTARDIKVREDPAFRDYVLIKPTRIQIYDAGMLKADLNGNNIYVWGYFGERTHITPVGVGIYALVNTELVKKAEFNKDGLFIAEGGKICIGDRCVLSLDQAGPWKETGEGIEYSDGVADVFNKSTGDFVRISPTGVSLRSIVAGEETNYAELNKDGLFAENVHAKSVVKSTRVVVEGGNPLSSSGNIFPTELNGDGIYVPPPSMLLGWHCTGEVCYKKGSGEVSLYTALSDCVGAGAHLCSAAEYGHIIGAEILGKLGSFVSADMPGEYWTSEPATGLLGAMDTYYKKIVISDGNPPPGGVPSYVWGLYDEDISNTHKYYCCKYIGAVYNTS